MSNETTLGPRYALDLVLCPVQWSGVWVRDHVTMHKMSLSIINKGAHKCSFSVSRIQIMPMHKSLVTTQLKYTSKN